MLILSAVFFALSTCTDVLSDVYSLEIRDAFEMHACYVSAELLRWGDLRWRLIAAVYLEFSLHITNLSAKHSNIPANRHTEELHCLFSNSSRF